MREVRKSEFTATLELSHPAVAAKYNSKLLFDYALAKYREDGYSKEVKTMQADLDPVDRALEAIIISQYKKKIFSKNGLLIKPVVMMKSKTTAESSEMEKIFAEKIRNLREEDIDKISRLGGNETLQQAFRFFTQYGISTANLIDELKDDFSGDKIISVNSKNDSDEKQIIINTLEARENEYRVVFAVDKLNEGWDVLNLFDIVRLYETRDLNTKTGKPGKTTVQEAQLIGRGARYCPFKTLAEQEVDKRKFDTDLENELRVCEELHYHCSHNPRYIQELNTALREIGIVPAEKREVFLELKDEFKATKFYQTGFVYLNKKVENVSHINLDYQEPAIKRSYDYKLRTLASTESAIFEEQETMQVDRKTQLYQPILWDHVILKKAMCKIPFYRFDNLKRFFPSVKSVDDFISKKLSDVEVNVTGLEKDIKNLSPKHKLNICLSIFNTIAEEIHLTFGDFRGTKDFRREPVRKVFRDKKMYFAIEEGSDKETGKPTMRSDIDEKYFIDLKSRDWHAYNDNFGSSEEKLLVKFLDSQMDELENLFSEIEHETIELIQTDKIRIIGMPFYNKTERERQFRDKLKEIISN